MKNKSYTTKGVISEAAFTNVIFAFVKCEFKYLAFHKCEVGAFKKKEKQATVLQLRAQELAYTKCELVSSHLRNAKYSSFVDRKLDSDRNCLNSKLHLLKHQFNPLQPPRHASVSRFSSISNLISQLVPINSSQLGFGCPFVRLFSFHLRRFTTLFAAAAFLSCYPAQIIPGLFILVPFFCLSYVVVDYWFLVALPSRRPSV